MKTAKALVFPVVLLILAEIGARAAGPSDSVAPPSEVFDAFLVSRRSATDRSSSPRAIRSSAPSAASSSAQASALRSVSRWARCAPWTAFSNWRSNFCGRFRRWR
jgi:hypothetical protein